MWCLKSGQWTFHLYIWENLTKYTVMMMKKKVFLTLRTPWKALGTPRHHWTVAWELLLQMVVTHFCDDQQGAACRLLLTDPHRDQAQTLTTAVSLSHWGDPGTHSPLPATLRDRPQRAVWGAPWGDPRARSSAGRAVDTTSQVLTFSQIRLTSSPGKHRQGQKRHAHQTALNRPHF